MSTITRQYEHLSPTQVEAMRDTVQLTEQGYVLPLAGTHGNAVRGLQRHGLLNITSATHAVLTPVGIRLHAALNGSDPVEAIIDHARAIKGSGDMESTAGALLNAAGLSV